jgi:hypothetical protein
MAVETSTMTVLVTATTVGVLAWTAAAAKGDYNGPTQKVSDWQN